MRQFCDPSRQVSNRFALKFKLFNEHVEAMEAEADKALSFLEGLEAAARQKLAEQSDEQAVERIVSTAWYQ